MKFNLNKILVNLPLLFAATAVTTCAVAQQEELESAFVDGSNVKAYRASDVKQETATYNFEQSIKNKLANQYFVILQDEPLAAYTGGTKNLDATNILASKNSNVTANGKLDTKSLASKQYKHFLSNKQAEIELHINARLKRNVEITHRYDTVLNGFTADLSASEAILISQLPGVKAVDKAVISRIDTDSGPRYSGATKVWNGTQSTSGFKGEGLVVGVIDSGIASFLEPIEDIHDLENLPDFHPSFADVGADGYDHTNPYGEGNYFGNCADQIVDDKTTAGEPNWCNDKLVGVLSFSFLAEALVYVKDQDTGDKVIDPQRSYSGQDTNGHGTHVASTVAGNVVKNIETESPLGGPLLDVFPQDFVYDQISGVAPHANIVSYQACDSRGYCYQQFTIMAIEHAIDNGIDVLNYSVGSNPAMPWYDWVSLAFLNAREANIHVATSAGNSGASGKASVRTPGNSPWVTSTAAINHDRGFDDKKLTLLGGDPSFELDTNVLIGKGATKALSATDVVYAGDVETATAEDDFEIEASCGVDSLIPEKVAGKVVICKRGGASVDGPLSRVIKGYAVYKAGGAGMILINVRDGAENVQADFHSVPAIHLEEKVGRLLLEWLDEGEGHQVALSDSKLVSSTTYDEDKDFSGIVAAFSSQGPDRFNLDYLVPQISAPGMDILAAGLGKGMQEYLENESQITDKNFIYRSGTSMASPHVAGMFILMKGAHPEWSASEMQSALMLTAGTNIKVLGPYEKNKQTFDLADFHSTGAGLARVDLAIETGLVMGETKAGYLAADPFGDIPIVAMPNYPGEPDDDEEINYRDLKKDLPAGWHGEPSKMNIASMSKGKCIDHCSWTRTLTATKDANWRVSYSYIGKGMTLSSDFDDQLIPLVAGEEFTITVTAQVNDKVENAWTDGRIHLTPSDESIPAVSIPVTVEFVAGSAPESVEITANRNVGQVAVKGVVSIGTEKLATQVSNLGEATEYTIELQRDIDPSNIRTGFHQSSYLMPISIPSGSDRFVLEILETSSPDVDVYVGQDLDLNGVPSIFEWTRIHFWGTGQNALEKLSYNSPNKGDYWIMIHNFGNKFNDEEHEDFDQQIADKIDTIKFIVSVANDDFEQESNEQLKISTQKENEPNSKVPMTLKWNKDMSEGKFYFGKLDIGTKPDLMGNIGTVDIDMYRSTDDVRLTQLSNDHTEQLAAYNIAFLANSETFDKSYEMTIELVDGAVLESLTIESGANGDGTNGQALDFAQEGNVITWTQNHASNAGAETVTIVFDYREVGGYSDITPEVLSLLNDEEAPQLASTLAEMINGRPVFEIDVSDSSPVIGDVVTLNAVLIDGVIDNPILDYTWHQVSGPEVNITFNDSAISFTAPKGGKELVFKFIGHNSKRESTPELTSIFVEKEETVSGSTGLIWFALSLLGLLIRRQQTVK